MPLESPAAHPAGRRRVRRTALAVLAAATVTIAACSSDADVAEPTTLTSPRSEQSDDVTTSSPVATASSVVAATVPSVAAPIGVEPEGFTTVMVEITKADGSACEICVWLADTAGERGQGLMGVTSLGTPEGMAFVWEEPTAGAFFMFQTVTPLSIAWFGAPGGTSGGALVSTSDMEPCLSQNSAECERFPAGGDYVLAIEVFQGDLESIGITAGASARLLADTEATDCPLI